MRSINGFAVIRRSFSILFFLLLLQSSLASDTLFLGTSISGDQTLISVGEIFKLGFFKPGISENHYLGIWYNKVSIKTFVWVANRENPVTDSSGVFKITQDGNLVILDGKNRTIWDTNSSVSAQNPTVKLLDSGNLILISGGDVQNPLWQSFDYPSDTLLPGMKLGLDLKKGLNRFLTSWKNIGDPTPGNFFFKMDPHGSPEIFLLSNSTPTYRSGPWNGQGFSGVPEMKPSYVFNFSFLDDQDEIYYAFWPIDGSVISRLVLNQSGTLQRYTWIEPNQLWNLFWTAPKDQCDDYGECGVYGMCNTNDSPVCSCLQGFEPKNPQAWYLRDGSSGCVRKTELKCGNGDGFLKLEGMKLPDTSSAQVYGSLNLEECRTKCFESCSCTGYANSDINGGGSGCVIWTGDLIDLRQYSDSGQDLYVRLAASDLGDSTRKKRWMLVGILIPAFLAIVLVGSTGYCLLRRKKKEKDPVTEEKSQDILLATNRGGANGLSDATNLVETGKEEHELPLFNLGSLAVATNNFADENKIGEGGFGPVYKGLLLDGQEIAVKRLCTRSGQGVHEFMNEVKLISKLQHRNLVRLLGCCVERQEKILVYEYMRNKSLDFFLFDQARCGILDWRKRFHIIAGIARGLLYLHEDSRLRIIHRDLKASNILLDDEMNPKISDFGMARIFGGNQTEANTIKVVGTYGYMSPEYAMDGLFSVKSDVFSFGVLLLEIVAGKKNRSFLTPEYTVNLLGHAWQLWKEERGLELMDPSMCDTFCAGEVLRCIQVGLLCVQDIASDRPSMSSVVFMLGSETPTMPAPKQPTFFTGRALTETDSSSSRAQQTHTINEVTLTAIDAR